MVFIDLVLDNGDLIRVECPTEHEDALYESINNAMKRRDVWSRMQFDGCSADYLGMSIERINMARVVGML